MKKLPNFSFVLSFSIAAAVCGISHASAASVETVMITAFGPWGGNPINLTERVAKELKQNEASLLGEKVRIEVCNLPVEYDRSIVVAKDCFSRLKTKPSLVISLGEGGGRVDVELVGANLDGGHADEAGKTNEGKIEAQGPDHVFSTLPIHLFTTTELQIKDENFLNISEDAGDYVCNHNAYLMGKHFAKKRIPYGFVHLPSFRWSTTDEKAEMLAGHVPAKVSESARVLANIIKTSLNFYGRGSAKKKLNQTASSNCKTFQAVSKSN